jgi:thiol-disulfide isomerase/thioredoxin
MVKTASTMMPLGTAAPDFLLPDVVSGREVSLADFSGSKALLVMFICRHCPYVVHVREELARLGKDYRTRGVGIVAINSNDTKGYPEDAPPLLAAMAEELGFEFPFCHDETQEVAKKYGAACTPDFFLFDEGRKLVYRGQLDDSRPGNDRPVTGADLRAALDAALSGGSVVSDQKASLGCNIKWKPGNEPDYFKS